MPVANDTLPNLTYQSLFILSSITASEEEGADLLSRVNV